MRAELLGLVLLSLLIMGAAQENRSPASVRERDSAQSGPESTAGAAANQPSRSLPFCPPKTCLYYAGDFDSRKANANALYNFQNGSDGISGSVYVAVKPAESALITGATYNEFLTNSQVGINPTPFFVKINMSAGEGGSTVCITGGNAAVAVYGEPDFGLTQYSYTIKKLSKPCALRKGKTYFVLLLPEYSDGFSLGYVVDVEDMPPTNHRGWRNVFDDSFFASPYFGANYQPTWGEGGACGGVGCDAFSVALTGKKGQ